MEENIEQHNARVGNMIALMQSDGWKFLIEELNSRIDECKTNLVYADIIDIQSKQGFIKGLQNVINIALDMATKIDMQADTKH